MTLPAANSIGTNVTGALGYALGLPNCVALHAFDDSVIGDTLVDETLRGRDGTYTGGVSFAASTGMARVTKNAATFNGSNGRATIANHADLVSFGDFTVIFRASIISWPTTNLFHYLGGVWSTNDNQRCWAMLMGGPSAAVSADALSAVLSTTGSNTSVVAIAPKASITLGTSYTFALTRSGTTVTPYFDGVAGSTETVSGTLHASTAALYYGFGASIAYGNVRFDAGCIYKGTALTAAQIMALHLMMENGT